MGLIFVANYYEHEVSVLKLLPEKDFKSEQPIPVKQPPLAPTGKPVNGPCDLAIDSAGNLYVNRWHSDVLRYPRLTPGSPAYGPPTVIDPGGSTSVSVDSADRVFVDDRTYVAEYEPSGAPVLTGGEPVKIGLGSLGDGYGVAVSEFTGSPGFPSTAGRVYVADGADNTVKVYNPGVDPSAPVQTIDGGGTPQLGFRRLVDADVAVDPVDGHVYVVDNLQPFFEQPEAVLDEFSSLGYYRGAVPSAVTSGHPSDLVHGEPSGVAIVDHDVYLTSGNYYNDNDDNAKFHHENSRALIYGPTATVETRRLSATKTGAGTGTVFSSSPAGLGCGTACEGEFTLDTTVLLTALPAAHSRVAGWPGCQPRAGAPSQCGLTMGEDHTVSAEFEPIPPRHLTVLRSFVGAGSGMVTSAPAGIDCGVACEGDFDEGSEVTLTAVPAAGSGVDGWTGCDSNPSPGECRVTMNAARSVEAQFRDLPGPPPPPPVTPQRRILSVLATGTGTATGTVSSIPAGIDCGSSCARPYERGTGVTLVARPARGSRFLGWGGCDSAAGDRCTVTLGTDKTVVAAFGPGAPGPLRFRGLTVRGATAVLQVSVPGPGTLSASGSGLQPVSALPLAAGRVGLRLRLTASGRRSLAKRGELKVKVALAFTPFDGGTSVRVSKAVTFGSRGNRR
jgi:hypothetical protein